MEIKKIANLKSELEQLPIDIKAEVVAAELINQGVEKNKIVIRPRGISKRPYRKDILDVELPDEHADYREHIYIDVNREGLYDALPEALFHQPLSTKPFRPKEEIIDEIKVHRQEEKEARNFFLPFENEFAQQRIQLELTERKSSTGFEEGSNVQLFNYFFGATKIFDSYQVDLLLHLLPYVSQIRGDLKIVERCFSIIMGVNVSLKKQMRKVEYLFPDSHCSLSGFRLGIDSILGNTMTETEPMLKLVIGPVKREAAKDYLENGRMNKVIQYLCDFFLPIEINIETEVNLSEKDSRIMLQETSSSFLGLNSYL